MAFSFELLPALLGVLAYFVCVLLHVALPKCFRNNAVTPPPPSKDENDEQEKVADDSDVGDTSPQAGFLPEPELEPELEGSGSGTKNGSGAFKRWQIGCRWEKFFVGSAVFLLLGLGFLFLSPQGTCGQIKHNIVESDAVGLVVETANSSIDESAEESEEGVMVNRGRPEEPSMTNALGEPSSVLTVTLTRQSVNAEDDEDFVRSAYYGTIMVGSPPEPFTVVFDTGSGHLVLPSTYCRSETCRAHKRFRRSASSTAMDIDYDGTEVAANEPRDQITVSFGTGEITGVFVEDMICIEGMSNGEETDGATYANSSTVALDPETPPMGCVKLRMIAATEMSEEPFKSFQFDGILGLGLDGLSQAPEFNFLSVVAQSVEAWGGTMPHTFAVFLADNAAEESEIALGGWARDHLAEDVSWNPVPDPELGHWLLDIKGIYVNGERIKFCDEGCKAAVDTGTSLLAVPTAAFPELYELLRHPTSLAGHCEGHGPQLHIQLETFTVTLGPRDYARAEPTKAARPRQRLGKNGTVSKIPTSRNDLRCIPMLMTLDLPEPLGPKLFVMGEPVLRKYYTVYDGRSQSVGFARAKHQAVTTREDFIMDGGPQRLPARRSTPTMFDIFRWRKSRQYM